MVKTRLGLFMGMLLMGNLAFACCSADSDCSANAPNGTCYKGNCYSCQGDGDCESPANPLRASGNVFCLAGSCVARYAQGTGLCSQCSTSGCVGEIFVGGYPTDVPTDGPFPSGRGGSCSTVASSWTPPTCVPAGPVIPPAIPPVVPPAVPPVVPPAVPPVVPPVVPPPPPPPPLPPPPPPPVGTCGVGVRCGTVITGENNAPLEGAVVTLKDITGKRLAETFTDAAGQYAFVGLTPGAKYFVAAYPGRNWRVSPLQNCDYSSFKADFKIRGITAKLNFTGTNSSFVLFSTFSYTAATAPASSATALYDSMSITYGTTSIALPAATWFYTCWVPQPNGYVKRPSVKVSATDIAPNGSYSTDAGGNPLRCN